MDFESADTLANLLNNTLLRLDSKVFFQDQDGRVLEVYRKGARPSTKDLLVVQEACQDPFTLCNPMEHIWNRRSNLTGVHLLGAYNTYVPLAMLNPVTGELDGYFPDIFYRLQEVLNFTYSVVPSVDGSHGGRRADGTWSGVVGMLHRREVDVNIGSQVRNCN